MSVTRDMQRGLESGRREIGHAGGYHAGPLLVCVAGVHGNEPSGVVALERVFRRLEEERMDVRGEIVGLRGNLAALEHGARFVEQDLNRVWSRDAVERLEGLSDSELSVEDAEQRGLLKAMHHYVDRAKRDVVMLDLHSTSSDTRPFIVFGDTLRNREVARFLPLPVILGLEEELAGTLMEYFTGLGHRAVVLEAGQHDDPRSAEYHEACVWVVLVKLGLLAARDVPGYRNYLAQLERAGAGVPGIMEILDRHGVTPGDGFEMQPGFENFESVEKGQVLAHDHNGPIRARHSLRLFMPLYQGQGDDGFFLARRVNPVWLALSAILRRIGAPKIAHWLPGVEKHPDLANTLVVDPRTARFFVREFFHLLGFRVETADGGPWIVERRRER